MGVSNYTWAVFWGFAGFMAGIAVAFFLLPLWQAASASPMRRYRVILSASAVFVGAAVMLYLLRGEPDAINPVVQSSSPHGLGMSSAAGNDDAAGTMEQAAQRLAMRLRDGKGSDADWTLLKQSYEFLGDKEGASLAEQHRVKANLPEATEAVSQTSSAADPALSTKLAPFQQRVANNPKDAEAWLAIAELNRSARHYIDANAAYEKVIALKKMNAASWADYADSVASQIKSLNNPQTIQALDAALKLDPNHLKALWLEASLLNETGRYREALTGWQKLQALVPRDSSDYKLVEDNVSEARSLLEGNTVAQVPTAEVKGSVDVDESIKAKISSDMTLFVFAKPVDSPGPPAAVLRVPVKTWPMNFLLDDSLAMMPTRKLSLFRTVSVQARLSRTGQAMPQMGDVQSDAVIVDVNANKSVLLKLTKAVE